MRLVLDTNVVVAGLLWSNHSRRLLDLAADNAISLYSSAALIEELTNTLQYPKLERRIALIQSTPRVLLERYSALVTFVSPLHVPRIIEHDVDDDQVLACAVAALAKLITSGDKHLHSLGGQYKGIRIVTPAEAVKVLEFI